MRRFEVVIGGITFAPEDVLQFKAEPLGASPRRAVVEVASSSAALREVDLNMRVSVRHVETGNPEFTGVVDKAEIRDDGVIALGLVTEDILLAEQRMDRMRHWRSERRDGVDVLYSLVRAFGSQEDEMDFDVYTPRIATFEVSVPLNNIHLDDPLAIGDVTLTSTAELEHAIDDSQSEPLAARWRETGAWAITFVTAKNLIEAEWGGLEKIDSSLSCLMLGTRLGTLLIPDGSMVSFDRRLATRADVSRADLVHVRSMSDGRRWVRGLSTTSERIPLDPSSSRLALEPPSDDRERLALDAWRRAVLASDPLIEMTAIWQSWEFYAAGMRVPKLFTRAQREKLKRLATSENYENTTLTPEQRARVESRLDQLNDVPLLETIEYALRSDGVPFTGADLDALGRHRSARNDIDHGRRFVLPRGSDRRAVQALLTRALAWRLAKRSTGT